MVAILSIVIAGEPVLHTPAYPVEEITDSLRDLVADMVETMHAAPGVGLAAPQVGVPLRLFVWHYDDGTTLSSGHVVNPHLSLAGAPRAAWREEPDEEGCLSIPGARFPLARYSQARLTGHTLDGESLDIRATGWLARIFQHEYDHLQGILYADRIARKYAMECREHLELHGWGVPGHSWTPGIDGDEGDFWEDDDSSEEGT